MENKKKIALFILLFCLSSGLFLHSEQIYPFKSPDYRIETTEESFHKIIMEWYFSYGVPGYPDVPSKIYQIAIPPNIDLNSIEVEYHERGRISLGKYQIKELPPMATWVDGERIIGEKADIYSKDSYYPENIIEYLGISQMRKWQIVNIKHTPFQYNPITKDLIFVPEVTLVIRYSGPSLRFLSDMELTDTVMDRKAKKILINYSEAREWYMPKGVVLTPLQTYNYVIITTNAIYAASTKLTDFINYLTGKGYSVKVITETDFEGLTGQSPNTKAEKIREWLKNNYISMGIEYVLLIGNPSPFESGEGDIPMKMCWPYYDPIDGLYDSPTDYFYADLTGNWDLDGDGYFGEYPDDRGIGGVDFTNEVYVGRIPVYFGVSDLDSVLSKIISYGNPPDISWRRSALLPLSFSDSSTDKAYLGEAMKSDYLSPSDYSSWTLYMQGSLCQEADSSFISDEELLDGATKTNWMNNPYGMVWWGGHGSAIGAYIGYGGCGSGTIMNSFDAPSLNDDFPSFVYQCSCHNGYPENSNNLGTALLYNGAVATVSASRVSWYASTSWYTGLKYYCDNASIGYYYGQELVSNEKKAAVALYDIKNDMGINGGMWGGQSWMNLFDFNLYGSPEIYIIVKYDLDISANQGGTISLSSGIYIYPAGTEVTITATPDTDYRFSGWTGDVPPDQENDNPITITMDSDKSATANFIRQYNLTISAEPGGITEPLPDTYIHDSGEEVSILATPDENYRFTQWTGDVPPDQENNNPLIVSIDSDKSVTANFIRQYKLEISAGTGGTTNPSPNIYSYDIGAEISIEAIPDENYRFVNWTGDASGTINPIIITMDSDKSVTANFIRQYKLEISAGTGGTTNPSPGAYIHDSGTEVTIQATANSGYNFASWSGDASGTINLITITMDSDKSVTANFKAIPPSPKAEDGCFIATAAYGSPIHPHLDILRDLRDKYLMPTKLGHKLVELYYKYSPYFADLIVKNKILKVAIRISLLPLVVFGYSMVHFGPTFTAVMLVIIFAIPIFLVTITPKNMRRIISSYYFKIFRLRM